MAIGSQRRSLAVGFTLIAIGGSLALFRAPLFQAFFDSLSFERRLEILNNNRKEFYESLPLLFGFLVLTVGVFRVWFGRAHGLLLRDRSFAMRLCAFAPPAHLLGALFLLFLPWINVQCHYTMRNEQFGSGSELVARQTGWNVAWGTYENKAKTSLLKPVDPNEKYLSKEPEGCPMVATYALLVIIGIIAGLQLREGLLRLATLVSGSLVAAALLLLQAQRGFPIAESVSELNDLMQRDPTFMANDSLVKGPPHAVLQVTSWFYAAVVVPCLAALAAGLDWLVRRNPRQLPGTEVAAKVEPG